MKWHTGLVGALLAVHTLLLGIAVAASSPTRNEVAHLPAGISHWRLNTFSFYNVNPPLWRMLAVLPVMPLEPETDWIILPTQPGGRPEWQSAGTFAEDNSTHYWEMVQLSRVMGVFWSLLCAIVVYSWARQLYGPVAALVGLTLWCFDPNVLGHAPLLTPDMPLTLAVFGATYVFWQRRRQPTWESALWCGLVLGLTQLTKFTALLLYFIWPTLWLIGLIARRCSSKREPLAGYLAAAGRALLIGTASVLVINLGYAFDASFQRLKDFRFASKTLRTDGEQEARWGNRFQDNWLGELPVPLPADYVQGIDLQRVDFEKGLKSYLNGEIRGSGWWYYYLFAFLYKVPLGTIALVAWTAALTLIRLPRTRSPFFQEGRGAGFSDELFVWLPAVILFVVVSSQTGFNHHFRYVLPIFPFLFVATSRVGLFFEGRFEGSKDSPRRVVKACLAACALGGTLLVWSVSSSLSVFPHSMSYFNEWAGGPDNGYKHLIDSNIDWGQDLWFLKRWIERHPEARPLFVAYHNHIDYRIITGMSFPEPPRDQPVDRQTANSLALDRYGPHPGYFAVDVRNLILGPYTYFQRFTPIAKAGYSIFIYHLTPEEADAARGDMGLPPLTRVHAPKP